MVGRGMTGWDREDPQTATGGDDYDQQVKNLDRIALGLVEMRRTGTTDTRLDDQVSLPAETSTGKIARGLLARQKGDRK